MNNRATFYDIENMCQLHFDKLEGIYHLCAPENHPIIFRSKEELASGMNFMGIAAKAHRQIRLMTFELMSNHIHAIVVGGKSDMSDFFNCFKKLVARNLHIKDLTGFTMQLHTIATLENLRNAIAYANRNGSVIDNNVCPYTYPWGANMYFFNPQAQKRYNEQKSKATIREIREITRSRKFDQIDDLYLVDGYICPMSFCFITDGERMFRDARHYFTKISRHIESYDEIAKMIGEQVYYTDDDLFSIACTISTQKYDCRIPSLLEKDDKIALAKFLNHKYNAGIKQLRRILKIDMSLLQALFGSSPT